MVFLVPELIWGNRDSGCTVLGEKTINDGVVFLQPQSWFFSHNSMSWILFVCDDFFKINKQYIIFSTYL